MMGDDKWCPQHGYPLPCDKCGMPSKTQKELIDDRIDSLKELAGLFDDGYSREIQRGIKELEWVRRMMEDKKGEK